MARPKGSKNKPKIFDMKVEDVKPIPEVGVDDKIQPESKSGSERAIIEGWVNVQAQPTRKRINYYMGGDIHETQEQAKKVASAYTIGSVYIRFERR